MSLESVRAFFRIRAPDIAIIETDASSSTVELAAQAHGVEPAQIAKTICLSVGERVLLVVASGTARLDNRKIKDVLGGKGRMLGAEEVLAATSHPIGGVVRSACPRHFQSIAMSRCGASRRWCRRRVRPMPR